MRLRRLLSKNSKCHCPGFSCASDALEPPSGQITGTVNDPSGSQHRIRVSAFLLRTPNGYPVFTMTCQTVTDSEGNYACVKVPSGQYIILANLTHSISGPSIAQEDMLAPSYYPGTTDVEDAELVRVRPDSLHVFNFSLAQGSLFQISGWVEGKPKSAVLALYRIDVVRGFKLPSELIAKYDPTTGLFVVRGVPDGQYVLTAHWYSSSISHDSSALETPLMGSLTKTVADSNVSNVVLKAAPLTVLDGHLEVDGAPPGQSLNLVLQSVDDSEQKYGIAVHLAGVFRLSNLPCGRYWISGVSLAGGYVQSVKVGDFAPTSGLMLMIPDNSRVHVDIGLSLRSEIILGSVSDWTPEDHHVYVLAKNETTRSMHLAEADGSGRFTIGGLAPGRYDLYAWTCLTGIAYETEYELKRYESEKVVVTTGEQMLGEPAVVPLITRATY